MKPYTLLPATRVAAVAFALLGGAILVGCGGGTSDYAVDPPIFPAPPSPPPAPPPSPPAPPPAPAIDAFFAMVLALVANSPDDAEPVNIDSIIVTAPEDTEPQPLG